MANNLDLLESDHKNLSQEDGQSQASGSTVVTCRRSNNRLRGDLQMRMIKLMIEEVTIPSDRIGG